MSGRMMNYDKYVKSLSYMAEPVVPKMKIDMRGAMAFAKKKGVCVADLSREDKARFMKPSA